MKLLEVFTHFGFNWANAMRQCEFCSHTYTRWIKLGYIPIHSQAKIEEMTKGKLKASLKDEIKDDEYFKAIANRQGY